MNNLKIKLKKSDKKFHYYLKSIFGIETKRWFNYETARYKRLQSEYPSQYICYEYRYVFLHNPKCAGTSIKALLGFEGCLTTHKYPGQAFHPKIWEDFSSVLVVRNPFDKLVSSWSYHTSKKYKGAQFRRFGERLHELTLQEYFYLIKDNTKAIDPQVRFLGHGKSAKKISFIIRMENLYEDLEKVVVAFPTLKIEHLKHKNKSKHNKYSEYFTDQAFTLDVMEYYKDDFSEFGYNIEEFFHRN